MCDDVCFTDLTRREFGAGALAAGTLLAAKGAYAADLTESDVTVSTPDGKADAFFVHPKTGTHPGVLIWTDIMGLRPAFRDMGRRLASEGFAVLTPNPFYRNGPAGPEGLGLSFGDPDARPKMMALMGALTAPGAPERDAGAYISWMEQQGAVKKGAKFGTSGYCMGGPLIMRTAAAYPDKVAAAASFHGGGLATDKPESPHLMIPKMKAQLYIGVADNDDAKEPMVKDTLKAAFAAAKVKAEIEVYKGANHGWCVPGGAVYNEEAANRAYGKLVALFKSALA